MQPSSVLTRTSSRRREATKHVTIRRPWGGVLEGEKGNLPVQTRRKYELIINLKTAKTFGVELPASVLARADEGIK